jgi:hypothetical protein
VRAGRSAAAPRFAGHGRITIEIELNTQPSLEVTVRRSCSDPLVVEVFETVLHEISQRWPGATVTWIELPAPHLVSKPETRRGGPAGTPREQRRAIVAGWLRAQGRVNQEVYARSKGVSTATLRRWMANLREQGQL